MNYLDLPREIVDMWNVESAIIVPTVLTVNGLISKSLDPHLRRLALGGGVKGLMLKALTRHCEEVHFSRARIAGLFPILIESYFTIF